MKGLPTEFLEHIIEIQVNRVICCCESHTTLNRKFMSIVILFVIYSTVKIKNCIMIDQVNLKICFLFRYKIPFK